MRALVLGARGAVGAVVARELARRGHTVTPAGRIAPAGGVSLDLTLPGSLGDLARLAGSHDVIVNASGIEQVEAAVAAAAVPWVEVSATGAYLEQLRDQAGSRVLGAGLVPGLSTVLVAGLQHRPGDEVDVLVMLGSGEEHGAAAVAWTAGLVGAPLYAPPEGREVPNLRSHVRAAGPDGRRRYYLRSDFPDHVLAGSPSGLVVRTFLTMSSGVATAALVLVGRVPRLRGLLERAPHVGSSEWHVIATNRRTGERREAWGEGQSEATGVITALAVERAALEPPHGAVTAADLLTLDDLAELEGITVRAAPGTGGGAHR